MKHLDFFSQRSDQKQASLWQRIVQLSRTSTKSWERALPSCESSILLLFVKDYSGLWSNTFASLSPSLPAARFFSFIAGDQDHWSRLMEAIFHEKVNFSVDFFLLVNLQMLILSMTTSFYLLYSKKVLFVPNTAWMPYSKVNFL